MDGIIRAPKIFQKSPSIYIPPELEFKFGVGFSYPSELNNQRWSTSSGEDKIRESMYSILTTPLGTRFMQPDYGSMLPFLVFEPYNDTFKSDLIFHTKAALERWEPRISLLKVEVDDSSIDTNAASLNVLYSIKGLNKRGQLTIVMGLENPIKFMASNQYTVSGNEVFK